MKDKLNFCRVHCYYHDYKDVKDIEAFDTEHRKIILDTIDYCSSLEDKCNPDECEYSEREVQVYELEAIKQILANHLIKPQTDPEINNIGLMTAIESLDRLIERKSE